MPPLDQNLFTLKIKRSEEEPGAFDFTDPLGQNLYYRKRLVPPGKQGEPGPSGLPLYDLWDPLSDSLLSTLLANAPTLAKKRTIQLYNPTVTVDLTFTGTINFRWQFDWETHTFEFRREEVFLLRRPDPPVLIAVYDFEKKQNKPEVGMVQLLDYNLTRFDIDDRKGLEIIILTGLLSFQEAITGQAMDNATGDQSMIKRVATLGMNSPPAPTLPPKDVGMQVAGLQIKEKADPNEVIVSSTFEVEEYADYACNLLKDDKMMFIVMRSKTAAEVPKVVSIASLVKRTRYKGGAYDEELHQYVKYDEEKKQPAKRPKVIKLDGPPSPKEAPSSSKDYRPPTALSIYLSKIALPELQPKAPPSNPTISHSSRPNLSVPAAVSSSSNGKGRAHSNDSRRDGGREGKLSKQKAKDQDRAKESNHGRAASSSPALQSTADRSKPQAVQFPGGFVPSGQQRPPQQRPPPPATEGPAPVRNSFWGGFHHSRSDSPPSPHVPPPQVPPRPQQSHQSSPPYQSMPGGYFPNNPPPPPPPAPMGFGGLLGTMLPSGQGGSGSVSNATKIVGNIGMQMYEKFTTKK